MITKIKKYFLEFNEKLFWKHPDSYWAAVILDDDKVFGEIKKNLAILKRIPKPETGYHYHDIVLVTGPIGKEIFREDEIDVYKAIGIYKKSNCPTFSFEAILPKSKDYFYLMDSFKGEKLKAEFPWSSEDNNGEWRKGYCTAPNIKIAQDILTRFVEKEPERKVKSIEICLE